MSAALPVLLSAGRRHPPGDGACTTPGTAAGQPLPRGNLCRHLRPPAGTCVSAREGEQKQNLLYILALSPLLLIGIFSLLVRLRPFWFYLFVLIVCLTLFCITCLLSKCLALHDAALCLIYTPAAVGLCGLMQAPLLHARHT